MKKILQLLLFGMLANILPLKVEHFSNGNKITNELNYSLSSRAAVGIVNINIDIDKLSLISGKSFFIKDGTTTIYNGIVTSSTINIPNLPVGTYDLLLPNTVIEPYTVNDTDKLIIKENQTTVVNIKYTKVSTEDRSLSGNKTMIFKGSYDRDFAYIKFDTANQTVTIQTLAGVPRSSHGASRYASVKILTETGAQLYYKEYIGNTTYSADSISLALRENYTIDVYHAEADKNYYDSYNMRRAFIDDTIGERDNTLNPKSIINNDMSLVVHKSGIFYKGTVADQDKYSAITEEHISTFANFMKRTIDTDKLPIVHYYKNYRNKLLAEILSLPVLRQEAYLKENEIIIKGARPSIIAKSNSIEQNRPFNPLNNIIATAADGTDISNKVTVTSNNVNITKVGTYEVSYSVTDNNGSFATAVIEIVVTSARLPEIIVSSELILYQYVSFPPLIDVRAQDADKKDITDKVLVIFNNLNAQVIGTYSFIYEVTDDYGNTARKERIVTVLESVKDKPQIIADDINILQNQTFDPLLGVSAIDGNGGNITKDIEVIFNNVDTTYLGEYTVIYEVIGNYDIKVSLERVVTVIENQTAKPTINASNVTIDQNQTFNPLNNVTATDSEGTDISNAIVVIFNNVDTKYAGKYSVIYEVSDFNDSKAQLEITVTVEATANSNNNNNNNILSLSDEQIMLTAISSAVALAIVIGLFVLTRSKGKKNNKAVQKTKAKSRY